MDGHKVRAIGFDLFNTLITAKPQGLKDALNRLTATLVRSGILLEPETFRKAYRESALRHIRAANRTGRETHNRFWISKALEPLGYDIAPGDPRISRAVDAYFSTFPDIYRLFPGTMEALHTLKRKYPLGLLSNFTHAPAATGILDRLGLSPLFQVTIISGRIGFRKPHPAGFRMLAESLKVENCQIIYVGDDPMADVNGAFRAGLRPVRCTWAGNRGSILPPGAVWNSVEVEPEEVPEVSTWEELLSLLR